MDILFETAQGAEKFTTLEEASIYAVKCWREEGNEIIKYDPIRLKTFDVYCFCLQRMYIATRDARIFSRDMYIAIWDVFEKEASNSA
jgi:hypothetical protein